MKGFTLLELMITIAIIAIISVIAFPSYQQYILRSYRVEARNALQALAQKIDQNYSFTHDYKKLSSPINNMTEMGNNIIEAWGINEVPSSGEKARYQIKFESINSGSYTLVATAINGQLADKRCSKFYYNQSGAKKAASQGQSEPETGRDEISIECWSK